MKTQLKQVQNQAQQGRSMIEMLGVLAIIGVLSIGGISGYRMAMNRYQANQIANEINLMRTDAKVKAAAQVTGKLMLGEPYDSGHLNFGSNYGVEFDFAVFSEAGEPEESGYYIKVSGVPAGVCKPLVTLLEGMDDAIAVVVNEQENDADSSADLCTEESNNALEVDFSTKDIGGASSGSGEEPEVTDPEQGDEPKCDEATCLGTCNEEDGTCQCPGDEHWTGTDCITCPTGTTWNDTERDCTCTGANEHWDGNRCVDCGGNEWDEENKECKCDENQYWSDSAGACIENPCNKDGNGCAADEFCRSSSCSYVCSGSSTSGTMTEEESCKNGTYKCEKINSYKADNKDTEDKNSPYILSQSSNLNWWSAERFCKAQHKHMVTISELNCCNQNLGGTTTGYCYAKGETCSSSNGVSEVVKALRRAKDGGDGSSGSGYLWLYDPYTSTTSGRNSCGAYYVYLINGYVYYNFRYNYNYALCE